MSVNLNEVTQLIRKVGPTKVRAVPMPGQNIHTGQYMIEIQEGSHWRVILESIPHETATSLITQATNKLILG